MKNVKNNELAVCGFAAVMALAQHNSQRIRRLYFTSDHTHDFGDTCRLLASRKAPYNIVETPAELEKLCGSVHHQGVVAMIDAPEIPPLTNTITQSWIANSEPAILLDRIGNANNLGAIVRSAAFFGIKNIIIPIDEAQSSITTSSYRVAQGGMEFVQLYTIRYTIRLLQDMAGKMERIGTDVTAKKPVSELRKLCSSKPPLIVLGNEEHGISSEVKENCDDLVIIPFAGMNTSDRTAAVESLNVAQAAAVIFYECSNLHSFPQEKGLEKK